MSTTYALLSGCWIILLAFWTVTAIKTKGTLERQSIASGLVWSILMVASFAMLFLSIKHYPFSIQVFPLSLQLAGVCITIAGLLFTLWSRIALGANWSRMAAVKRKHELIQSGPYALVRHPIYTGLLTMYLGSAIAIAGLGGSAGIIILSIALWIKLKQEEVLLEKHFRQKYLDYKRKVRALIPGVL